VKLAASLFCVAALSMAGCVDEMTNAGGQGEGLEPAKTISFDPIAELQDSPFNIDTAGIEVREGSERADNICVGCVVTTVLLPEDRGAIDEVRIVGIGGGEPICRIFLNNDHVIYDECRWTGWLD
jgi:hypothetical protein